MLPSLQDIEARLLPQLQEIAERLSRRFPHLRVHVFAGTVGSKTTYQGYHIGIECLFPNTPIDRSDNVALSLNFQHVPTSPKMNAGIVWGHPSGHCEAEWSDEWVGVTEAAVEQLFSGLWHLFQEFETTVERGYPSDELHEK